MSLADKARAYSKKLTEYRQKDYSHRDVVKVAFDYLQAMLKGDDKPFDCPIDSHEAQRKALKKARPEQRQGYTKEASTLNLKSSKDSKHKDDKYKKGYSNSKDFKSKDD